MGGKASTQSMPPPQDHPVLCPFSLTWSYTDLASVKVEVIPIIFLNLHSTWLGAKQTPPQHAARAWK